MDQEALSLGDPENEIENNQQMDRQMRKAQIFGDII